MAPKHNFLDVWIIESNTVYREVPFAVVTDWVQQNRLVPDDRVRPAGTKEWLPIAKLPTLSAYTAQAEPFRADDTAEALEPVHTGIVWRPHGGGHDDDVDMIPLIDVSLVLLVFFMMLRLLSNAGAGSPITTPEVEFKHNIAIAQTLWIGISDDPKGTTYAIGAGENGRTDLKDGLTQQQLLAELDQRTAGKPADVRIAADKTLPFETIKKLTFELDKRRPQHIGKIYTDVTQKESS